MSTKDKDDAPKTIAIQAPTIGRIVHYRFHAEHPDPDSNELGPVVVRPAVVVDVYDLDGPEAFRGRVDLLVQLNYGDTRAHHGTRHEQAAAPAKVADEVGVWFWPPMAPAAKGGAK